MKVLAWISATTGNAVMLDGGLNIWQMLTVDFFFMLAQIAFELRNKKR